MNYKDFNLPDGLKDFFEEIMEVAKNRFNVTIVHAEMRPSGYLKVRGEGAFQDAKEFNMLMHSYGKKAAFICRVCGKKGKHRRKEPNKPSLCNAHYFEYLNEHGVSRLEFLKHNNLLPEDSNE